MNDLLNAAGKPINASNKGHEDILNLIARVQNLESVVVMLATLAQKNMTVSDARELDIVMEAFWTAQTQRGAMHLARSDDKPDIFI